MAFIKTTFQNYPRNKHWKELQGRQCAYKRNNEPRLSNYCCRGKAIVIIYSECLSVALGIQHAKRMRRILFPPVLVEHYHILPHCLINDTIFGKITEHKMCVLILSRAFISNISHSKYNLIFMIITWWIHWVIIINICRLKYLLFLSDFNETWILATCFRKIPKHQNLRKFFHGEPSCSMRTDRHTDRYDEAKSRFPPFCERA